MDTTKAYIEMCEKAVEIQELRKYTNPFSGSAFAMRGEGDFIFYQDKKVVWLPRQDQLQELLQPCALGEIIQKFYEWFKDFEMRSTAIEYVQASMEQLWLAFVMKEKYNKIWKEDSWILNSTE